MTHSPLKAGLSLGSPAVYRIVVQGLLDQGASEFLGDMSVTTCRRAEHSPTTTLEGQLSDQAQLLGVLNSIYELHLPILEIKVVEEKDSRAPNAEGEPV